MVYRTDAFECFFENRGSDVLFITFNEMGMKADGVNYWCSAPARNLNISIFAFVSSGPNWFPADEMRRCLDVFWSCMAESPHTCVVAIGLSQGGYAAIKYGRMLGVNLAMSFSPQFSINPNDIKDHRFNDFFDPIKNHDMSIKGRDTFDGCYLFYDPYDRLDAAHARAIQKLGSIETFALPYAGHGSIRVFLGTNNLWTLVKACLASDVAGIRTLYSRLKRVSLERPWMLAINAAAKRPRAALGILNKYGNNPHDDRWLHVCWHLGEAGFGRHVIEWIVKFLESNPGHRHGRECLCLVSMRIGDRNTAISAAKDLLAEDPESANVQYLLKRASAMPAMAE